jgi:uncharacterized protein (TIGR03085 family)
VTKPNFARTERAALCDYLVAVGPDQPTLCAGWTTRDLAAHLAVRDRRPDAAAGIMLKPLAGHAEKVRRSEAAKPFESIVDRVRTPLRLSIAGIPPLDRLTNTSEFFIHHEDARRGGDGWQPRPLDEVLGRALFARLKPMARVRLRRFPAQLKIESPGYGEIACGAGGPDLTLRGDPGELTLFLAGRQNAARVELTGPDELADRLRTAPLGL